MSLKVSSGTPALHPKSAGAALHSAAPALPLATPDLISIRDLTTADVVRILALASQLKAHPADYRHALDGKQLVMFFEKPSLRTRLTFESGMASLGGSAFFVDQTASRLGAREPLADVAHNLERWVDAIVLRTFDHSTITQMAAHASIPVINGLSDLEHPCQALADFLTLQEKFERLSDVRLAYVGDGNNVAHSLLLVAALVGAHITVATPAGYAPSAEVVRAARAIARRTHASIGITTDPVAAVTGANAIYTDVWASMGQESETESRNQVFALYQVDSALLAHAAPGALFMHCLPAHRGQEVSAAVIDSEQSVVFDQAENRLHVQKAILLLLLNPAAAALHSPVRGIYV